MKFIVYCHTNKSNGKRYVGWAKIYAKCNGDPRKAMIKRWRGHVWDANNGSDCYFHHAIRKWGSGDDMWEHELLEAMITETGVKHAEQLWIQQRKTHAYSSGHHGYNETLGGDGVTGPMSKERYRKHCERLPRKSVVKCSLDGRYELRVYASIVDAARDVDGHSSGVSAVCRGHWKSYKGYTWKYN